jgi:ankyrin repeat protein
LSQVEIVHLLLTASAGIDAPTNNGTTPLLAASRNGHLDVVLALLAQVLQKQCYRFTSCTSSFTMGFVAGYGGKRCKHLDVPFFFGFPR